MDNGGQTLTDTWPWPSNPSFVLTEPTGNLEVTVNNIPAGGSQIPGNYGTVELYNNEGIVASASTSNNVALFNVIPVGSDYYYKVFHDPTYSSQPTIFGSEYWGIKNNIIINQGETTPSSFDRDMPYGLWDAGYEVKVYKAGVDVTGQTVPVGSELTITCYATNPSSSSQNVQINMVLDDDGNEPYVINSVSESQSISVDDITQFSFPFTLSVPDELYFCFATLTNVESIYIPTDTWPWSDNPIVTIIENPTGNLEVTVNNISVGGNQIPGNYGTVELHNNEGLVASASTINNIAFFDAIPAGSDYYIKVYHDPTYSSSPTIFGSEYWGMKDEISIADGQTTYETFDRSMPYGLWGENF